QKDIAMPQKPVQFVFISHDSRDSLLASRFADVISDLSAGKIRCFVASEKTGRGIEHGAEWYRVIMKKLGAAKSLVALVTPHSLNRPWILYEAGVARGFGCPVFGLALGVPFERTNQGPFGQFQNCDFTESSLTKLVVDILKAEPSIHQRQEAIHARVKAFINEVSDEIATFLSDQAFAEREASDWAVLRNMHEDFRELTQSLGNLLASGGLQSLSGSEKARKLSTTVMLRAQVCIKKLCPDAVCCLKIAESKDYLKCYFPPEGVKGSRPILDKIESQNSYSGLALTTGLEQFISSWRNSTVITYHTETSTVLEQSGVYGLIAWPIKIRLAAGTRVEPVAVFKIDFHSHEGLVDNRPTRIVIEKVIDVLALAFQEGLGTQVPTYKQGKRNGEKG
ncbi:MAG: toll/interleukin-1 receptor domain-containing protein, partial [Pirellulaceae bacterium]